MNKIGHSPEAHTCGSVFSIKFEQNQKYTEMKKTDHS